jgi:hypothetical protein
MSGIVAGMGQLCLQMTETESTISKRKKLLQDFTCHIAYKSEMDFDVRTLGMLNLLPPEKIDEIGLTRETTGLQTVNLKKDN